MEPIPDLEKVSRIEGVKGYYLVKHDGSLVAHKGDNALEVCPCIALSGLNADAICSLLGCSHFNYLVFSRQSKESIIVFPMNNHFLAVIKEAHAITANLIQKISELTDTTKTKRAV
ncbi:MAG: roadblock/LC7 domain-containing protein [Desulfatitalea sp.]|nr:roadblock/LC7 domain-containing protein [Desulfatitalea sp.]